MVLTRSVGTIKHNPVGVGFIFAPVPRVVPAAQPWALGHYRVAVFPQAPNTLFIRQSVEPFPLKKSLLIQWVTRLFQTHQIASFELAFCNTGEPLQRATDGAMLAVMYPFTKPQ
jgi:hypothetical protein